MNNLLTRDMMRESSVVQEWIEEGIEIGIERGIERGVEGGRREGHLESLRIIIQARFGPIPLSAEEQIARVSTAGLIALQKRAVSATTIEDVFS